MKVHLVPPNQEPIELDVEFRHFRRFSDDNKICQRGGHTSLSFVWKGKVKNFVTRCSLKDKFSKVNGRLICLQKSLKVIFPAQPLNIREYTQEKDFMELVLTKEVLPRYWWLKPTVLIAE